MNTAQPQFSASIESSLATLHSIWNDPAKLAMLRVCCADAFDKYGEAFVDADLQRMVKGAEQLARFEARHKS